MRPAASVEDVSLPTPAVPFHSARQPGAATFSWVGDPRPTAIAQCSIWLHISRDLARLPATDTRFCGDRAGLAIALIAQTRYQTYDRRVETMPEALDRGGRRYTVSGISPAADETMPPLRRDEWPI